RAGNNGTARTREGDMCCADHSGFDPYSLDNTTRTRLPPMVMAAICRTVWFLKARGTFMGAKNSASQMGCGLAVQVSIQSPASARCAWADGATKTAASAIAAVTERKDGRRHPVVRV